MGKVKLSITMSLDGFVAGPNDSPANPLGDGGASLFGWYFGGDTPYQMAGNVPPFRVSRVSAEHLAWAAQSVGAMVAGRRMFDIAEAWQGSPPGDGPTFIVTHRPPAEWVRAGSPFTFVTDGVESAIRQALAAAAQNDVAVASASIAQQCLAAGVLDEIHIDLAHVLLGGGVRLFDRLGGPIQLDEIHAVKGTGVTHLGFRVVYPGQAG